MRVVDTILNLIFPNFCISCGKKGSDFCIECLSISPFSNYQNIDWIFAIYDYQHPAIKKTIKSLKYKNKRGLAKIFGRVLYQRITEELADFSQLENFYNPILIPIPLASKRLRERGFNQSLLLCREIIKIDPEKKFVLMKNILKKPKETEHQANIENRNLRLKNITGCFVVKNPEKIKNRNIILIDDVVTTGATLTEAKKILKQNGARKVIAFVIAH